MKIIVVGAGSIGSRHIRNLIKLGYKNMSIVDKNANLLKHYSTNQFRCYKNYLEALRKERPEVAFICTPTALHLEHTKLALEFNCDIFIEKPISDTTLGLGNLKIKAKNKVVMVGCNWRFNVAYQSFERYIKSKEYGKPLYARIACGYYLPLARPGKDYKKVYASELNGGGVLLDSGSHVLNYLIDLFGDVAKINRLKNSINSLKIRSEEIAHILLEHKDGVTCDISLDYVSKKPINRIEVITDKGLLTLDLVQSTLIFDDGVRRKILFDENLDSDQMFLDEMKHFFKCIEKKSKPIQGIDEAKRVIEIILKGGSN